MNKKIDLNYRLTFIGNTGRIVIEPPFTIEFNIERKNIGSSNVGSIRIYNLNEQSRAIMRKDYRDSLFFPQVILDAGYGDDLSEIMNMSVSQAWSIRENNNFITQIKTVDGGFAAVQSKINFSVAANTNQRELLLRMARLGQKYNVKVGAISDQFSANTIGVRGNSYSGSWFDIIQEIANGGTFIDNSTINILKENEYIQQDVTVIGPSSGLLGTPTREFQYIHFDMLFEPKVKPATLIKFESVTGTEDINNTLYVVQNISHQGMISPAVAGSVTTSIGCLPGPSFAVRPEVQR